jgi:hypothetical protein
VFSRSIKTERRNEIVWVLILNNKLFLSSRDSMESLNERTPTTPLYKKSIQRVGSRDVDASHP